MTVSIILAITGVAANLVPFFQIVGASFGPICGAMAADYLLSGKKWAGPRRGINWAGYSAWALGFLVGIIPFLPVPAAVKEHSQPAVVYSFIVGFLVYALLAKAGLEPRHRCRSKRSASANHSAAMVPGMAAQRHERARSNYFFLNLVFTTTGVPLKPSLRRS